MATPISFSVRGSKFVCDFPSGPDKLWMADVKACRHGIRCDVFDDVLFVESNGTAFIYGIEFEDGRVPSLKPEVAAKQQAFVQFLRDETERDNLALGILAAVFDGHEYSSEGKATAAYIVQRNVPLAMGVGYRDKDGSYTRIAITDVEDGWLEGARSIIPFDELGQEELADS